MRRTATAALTALALATTGLAGLATTAPAQATEPVLVGFGATTITPHGEVPEPWQPYFTENPVTGVWGEPFDDLDGDGCYDGATTENGTSGEPFLGEPHTDVVANHAGDGVSVGVAEVNGVTIVGDPQSAGKWDGMWAGAGFGSQCAEGKLDDTWARTVVFDDGATPVAIVSVDVVGLFNEEVRRMRTELARRYPAIAEAGLEIVVSSTHTHEGVDTMGYWGQTLGIDGKSPSYQAYLRSQALDSIAQAWEARTPANASFARTQHTLGVRDSRDPQVIDPWLDAARFTDAETGEPLGTIVNWSNHPEALGGDNGLISSDFPGATRDRLEEVLGGTAVYFTGSVGGLMTPLRVDIPGYGAGVDVPRMRAIGRFVADAAIDALSDAGPIPLEDLSVAQRDVFITADNTALNGLNIAGVFDKDTFVGGDSWGADPAAWSKGVGYGRAGSQFRTELVRVEVGPASFVTVPGELFPELEVGFADRSDCPEAHTGAPDEPVMADHDPAQFPFVLGLGQDELGYIVPRRDLWFLHADHAPATLAHESGQEDPTADTPVGEHTHGHDGLVPVGALEASDPCGEGHYEETVSGSTLLAPWVTCVAAELAGSPSVWTDEEACSRSNTSTTPFGLGGSAVDGRLSHPGHDTAPVWGAGTTAETSGHGHAH